MHRFWIIGALLSTAAFGIDAEGCLELFSRATVIPENTGRSSSTRDLPIYGRLVKKGDELTQLPLPEDRPGNPDLPIRYLYIRDKAGHLALSPEVPDWNVDFKNPQTKILVTHRSLRDYFTAQFGRKPDVIEAGEFEILMVDGKTVWREINNAAGTYPTTDRESLDRAVLGFRFLGAPITNRTAIRDFSNGKPVIDRHVSRLNQALHALEHQNDPELSELVLLKKRLSQAFPDPNRAEAIDRTLLGKAFERFLDKPNTDPKLLEVVLAAYQYFEVSDDRSLPSTLASIRRLRYSIKTLEDSLIQAGILSEGSNKP